MMQQSLQLITPTKPLSISVRPKCETAGYRWLFCVLVIVLLISAGTLVHRQHGSSLKRMNQLLLSHPLVTGLRVWAPHETPDITCTEHLHSIQFNGSSAETWDWVHTDLQNDSCTRQKFSKEEAINLMKCKRILFIGDRMLSVVQLNGWIRNLREDGLMPENSTWVNGVEFHAEGVQYDWDCIDVSYHHRVFADEVARHLSYLNAEHTMMLEADIVVVGPALWDILHRPKVTEYRVNLDKITNQLQRLLGQVCHIQCSDSRLSQFHAGMKGKGVFWFTTGILLRERLDTPEKRERFFPSTVQEYRDAQNEVVIQQLAGREGFHVVDMHRISMTAPNTSVPDGMHHVEAVFDPAVMALLNMLVADLKITNATDFCDECANVHWLGEAYE